MLRRLGADRVINYREESVKQVLKSEYKKGVDLVWESVGGEMFETCVRALSNGGRLIVIGALWTLSCVFIAQPSMLPLILPPLGWLPSIMSAKCISFCP